VPLQSLALTQLRKVYWDYDLDDTYCPRASGYNLTKADLLAVLVPLELLGAAERATRIVARQALDAKAAACPMTAAHLKKLQAQAPAALKPLSAHVKKSQAYLQKSQAYLKKSKAHAAQSGAKIGRWTKAEHAAFLRGLGSSQQRQLSSINLLMQLVPSRSEKQIRTHAQKYFKSLAAPGVRKRQYD
jgi:hypothetical protein